MRNLENRVLSIGLTLSITAASLTGCNIVRAMEIPPTITSGVLPDITPRPSPTPILIPTSTPEPSPIPEPTATPTPEILAKPSIIVNHGDKTKAEIAFTFDDSGPELHKILNICREKGIKATFFLLTGEIRANPEIWRQAIKDGFQICNHGTSHNMELGKLSEEEIKKDILGWESAVRDVLGQEYLEKMKIDFPYFRSPGGNKTPLEQQVLGNLGYPITAYWSREECWFLSQKKIADAKNLVADPNYIPENNNVALVKNYISGAQNGAIFLIHGGKYSLVSEIIDKTRAKGYTFKLLSEILN